MSSLELPRAVSVASGSPALASVSESTSKENQEKVDGATSDESSFNSLYNVRHRPRVHDPARDLSIQVLEKFSLVTKFARETTSQLFRENHGNGFSPPQRRTHKQPSVADAHDEYYDAEEVPDQGPVAPDPLEVTLLIFKLVTNAVVAYTVLSRMV